MNDEETKELNKMKIVLDNGAFKPYKAHPEDAGFDLMARECRIVPAQGSAIFDTGVHIEIPQGFAGFLKSKSGLNVKRGITSEGVIDAGYTGSICVKLYNNAQIPYLVKRAIRYRSSSFCRFTATSLKSSIVLMRRHAAITDSAQAGGKQMECKDCIHNEVCYMREVCNNIEKLSCLDFIASADVQKIKHGKWIEDGYCDIPCVCSCCGAEAQYTSTFKETLEYDCEKLVLYRVRRNKKIY